MPEEEMPPSFPNPAELWKQWYETSASMWSRMLDNDAAKNAPAPVDPFAFFKQWYDSASETLSKMAGDVIANEEFLKASSEFLASYARLYRALRRNNEEYWHNLQLPTRSDVARVAELIVSLEEKVDHLDDALDELGTQIGPSDTADAIDARIGQIEQRLALAVSERQSADAAAVKELQRRLDTVERKLDSILDLLKTRGSAEAKAASPTARRASRKPAAE